MTRFGVCVAAVVLMSLGSCHSTDDAGDPTPEAAGPQRAAQYDRPGYTAYTSDGRLWVFRSGSEDLAEFLRVGEPGKCASLIGEGPEGMTLRSTDRMTILAWAASRPGYVTLPHDGRIWIFRESDEELVSARKGTFSDKCASMIGEGPHGTTLRAPEMATLQAYVAGR